MDKSKVEVLITTVNMLDPRQVLERMNIQTPAMIGNQTNYNEVSQFQYKGMNIPVFSFFERGVGLNRNNLLLRSTADFCVFGDDDLEYVDGYEDLICDAFSLHPDADVIIFNLEEDSGQHYVTKEDFRVNYLNFMRFGAARVVVRRKSVSMNAISFNQNFGGGTQYSNGEDTIFLCDCLKRGLKIYAVNMTLAKLNEIHTSTWFEGYTEKYFSDKGILYYTMFRNWTWLICLQDALRHYRRYNIGNPFCCYKMMMDGKRKYLAQLK